jgi:nicotinate-nucleotide pyrophosphorylase (carboxylating)
MSHLPLLLVETAVKSALLEDFGRAGDITSLATLTKNAQAKAILSTRESGVLAGLDFVITAFRLTDPNIHIETFKSDGDVLKAGDVICVVTGSARSILAGERVGLNFMMHLSGIATYTAQFVKEIAHTNAKVTCTRKTIPGLRSFAKYAVRLGGGSTHRYGLDDAILIKDNHIAVSNSVTNAIMNAKNFAGHLVKIECEVTTIEQFKEALEAKPDVILLDNMSCEMLKQCVDLNQGRVVLEASGGISLSTIKSVAQTGVDFISTSKITMSAPTLDVGLDVEVQSCAL